MQIKLHGSLEKAKLVMDLFNMDNRYNPSHPTLDGEGGITARCFGAGREQGFIIHPEIYGNGRVIKRTIAWAECKNSDSLVIYHTDEDMNFFSHPDSFPDEFWDSGVYFTPNQLPEAAKYIQNLIQAMVIAYEVELQEAK